MVPRSRRGARALPVLGWQGLVSGYFTKSERTSAHPGSGRRGDGPPGGQTGQTAYGQTGQPTYGQSGQPYGQSGQPGYGQSPYGQNYGSAYANYQELEKKKTPIGWWIAGVALVVVIVVVAVLAIRAVTGGGTGITGGPVGPTIAGRLPCGEHGQPRARIPPVGWTSSRRSGFLPDARLAVGRAAR